MNLEVQLDEILKELAFDNYEFGETEEGEVYVEVFAFGELQCIFAFPEGKLQVLKRGTDF